jgi:hypothetical protein
MIRISTSIFDFDGYSVKYDKKSCYITCTCSDFASEGKCVHIDEPRQLLKSEGFEVKLKRVVRPIFIEEIERFTDSVRKVLAL